MEKTKRQLRAKAVERLRDSYYTSDSDLMRAMLNWGHEPHTGDDSRFALIDLLTDDEPPEGDAVSIMRDVADRSDRHTLYHGMYETMRAIQQEPEDGRMTGSELAIAMRKLADMVERDYVRRDVCEAKCAELSAMRDRAWGAEAERDEWKAKAERQAEAIGEWELRCERLESECDEVERERDGLAVLQAIDALRRELSDYHGQLKAWNDLKLHSDRQRARIATLEGLYANAKARIAQLEGRRTCTMERSFTKPSQLDSMQEYLCSECGEYAYEQVLDDSDGLDWCPHCGCRVQR